MARYTVGICRSCWLDGSVRQSGRYLGRIGGDMASNRRRDTHLGSFQRYDALRSQSLLCWKRGCMLVEGMVLQQGQLMLVTSSIAPQGGDRICCNHPYSSSLGEVADIKREEDERWRNVEGEGAKRGAPTIRSVPACTHTAVAVYLLTLPDCLPEVPTYY